MEYQVLGSRYSRMSSIDDRIALSITQRRSLVIDRLVAFYSCQNVAVAYHYFDFRDQQCQSVEAMLSSLLKQLATAKTELSYHVLELYQKFTRQQRQPKHEDLEEVMVPTCEAFDRVFLIIDALDECSPERRRKVLEALKRLHEVQSVSIFVTSRPYPGDVKEAFEPFPKIDIEARDPDIRKYVRREIDNNHSLDDTDEEFKEEIVVKMSQKARKMYPVSDLAFSGERVLIQSIQVSVSCTSDRGCPERADHGRYGGGSSKDASGPR